MKRHIARRFTFFYLPVAIILLTGFVFWGSSNAGSGLGALNSTDDELLINQWVVVAAEDTHSRQDISERFKATVWQFLKEGSFVQIKEDIIGPVGKWKVRTNTLYLQDGEGEGTQVYSIERLRGNELLLKSKNIQIRLLKLDD